MALKKSITKEQYEKLSKDLQSEYIADGDGYRLDVEGEQDTGALKRAKDRETQLRQEAEKKAKELEEKLAEIDGNDARKKGDIETLEKQWEVKKNKEIEALKASFETEKNELTSKVSKYETGFKTTLIDNTAATLAAKLNPKAPKVLIPHIKERLIADFDSDVPTTKILKDGKPSNMTLDDLHKEFVANKDFAGIIIGSQSSGGAGDQSSSASRQNFNDQQQQQDLSKMNPAQLAEHIKSVREAESQGN